MYDKNSLDPCSIGILDRLMAKVDVTLKGVS